MINIVQKQPRCVWGVSLKLSEFTTILRCSNIFILLAGIKKKHKNKLKGPKPLFKALTCTDHFIITHSIHVWYIYLHYVNLYGINVGKYTGPMDPSWALHQPRNSKASAFKPLSWAHLVTLQATGGWWALAIATLQNHPEKNRSCRINLKLGTKPGGDTLKSCFSRSFVVFCCEQKSLFQIWFQFPMPTLMMHKSTHLEKNG